MPPYELRKRATEFKALASRIERALEIHPRILDPVAQYLAGDPSEPAAHEPANIASINLAFASVEVVVSCGTHLMSNNALAERIRALWPDVWKWCSYLMDWIVEDFHATQRAHLGLVQIAELFTRLCALKSLHEIIIGTPALLRTVTQYWIEEDGLAQAGIQDIFCTLIRVAPEHGHVDYNEVLQAARPLAIAKTALRRLRSQMAMGPPTTPAITSGFYLLDALSRCHREMSTAFLSLDTMSAIIRYLKTLLDWRLDDLSKNALYPGCSFIRKVCLNSSDGREWCRQAVRSGLIPLALASIRLEGYLASQSAEDGRLAREQFFGVLQDVVVPHLVHRRLIRAVSKAVTRVKVPDGLSTYHCEVWRRFLELVGERHTTLNAYEISYSKRCRSCQKVVDKNELRIAQCSACKDSRYCSKTCQATDWPGHRLVCEQSSRLYKGNASVPDPDGPNSGIPFHDYRFFVALANAEFHKPAHVQEYSAILRRRFSSRESFEGLEFRMDLMVYPPHLSVEDAVHVPTSAEAGQAVEGVVALVATVLWSYGRAYIRLPVQAPAELFNSIQAA